MRTRLQAFLLASALTLLALLTMGVGGPSGAPTGHLQEVVAAQGQAPEANLPYLFAVYAITWLAFFAYAFYISRRQSELRREIEALRQELGQRHSPPHS